jgi:membrane fusion protein, multidrug efflux system
VIRPRVEADLGFRVAGKLAQRLVEVGARVEKGTVLAHLDPADHDLQVRAGEAQLASAQAEATRASEDFQRYAQLRRGEWSTQQEFDRRKATMETAAARVREIEAQLKVFRNNARYTSLVADEPGVITAVLAEPGQVLPSGQPVFRMARLGEVEAVANVPEQQLALVREAQLSVELWAMPGETASGKLRELAPSADAMTRTYQVRVSIAEVPAGTELGMTATLIATRKRDGRIARLPLSAIAQQGNAPAVWTIAEDGETLRLKPVAVAAYVADQVIVAGGLEDGVRVVTAGVHKLDAAQKVRVWTEPER